MAHITASDLLFATLSQRGRIIASLRLRGLTTFAEIVAYIRRTFTGVTGLIKLSLRCPSRGWSQERNVMLADESLIAAAVAPLAAVTLAGSIKKEAAPRGGGVQLTLF